MEKKLNVLASKLRPVKTFKGEKMLFYRSGVKAQIWLLSAWNFLCVLQMYFHSQKQIKVVANDMLSAICLWCNVTSKAQRNDVAHHLTGCIFGSNGSILIPFVANCSWMLLNSYQAIKSILKIGSISTHPFHFNKLLPDILAHAWKQLPGMSQYILAS